MKLHQLGASALVEMVRTRQVSSREVVEAHLARIDALDGELGAVTVVLRESALAAADAIDSRGAGAVSGPLVGVPFTVKESLDCVGSPTTMGLTALRDALPYVDAPAVARMKAAGAIPIARTNMSELGMRFCADNPLRGRTNNPWNRGLTPGGSSGGDAVAVATGMAPLGLGNDMGGSLRVPAHACGVAALKPTAGRVAHAASLEPLDFGIAGQLMLADGPIARTVADLRLALSVLAGRDVRDPRSVDAPLVGRAIDEPRAALVTELPGRPLPSIVVEQIERAGALLEAAGWIVEQAAPPELTRVNELFGRLFSADFSVVLPLMKPILSEELFEYMERLCRVHDHRAVSQHWVHTERSRLTRAWSGFFAEYAVAIGPVWATPIWHVDADLAPATGLRLLEDMSRWVVPANVLGLPALALPTSVVDGVPAGIQIYADLWREDLCLAAAEIIERGTTMPTPVTPRFTTA